MRGFPYVRCGGTPTLPVMFLEFRQSEFFGLAAFDGEGRVVWYFRAPEGERPYVMARRPNGNIVYLAGFKGGITVIVRNIFDHLSPADRTAPASNRTLRGHPIWGISASLL